APAADRAACSTGSWRRPAWGMEWALHRPRTGRWACGLRRRQRTEVYGLGTGGARHMRLDLALRTDSPVARRVRSQRSCIDIIISNTSSDKTENSAKPQK